MDMFDRNKIPKEERVSMRYARGIALELIRWVRTFCVVKRSSGMVVEDLPTEYLARQMATLLKYKEDAVSDDIFGAPQCTLELLRIQIENVPTCDEALSRYWHAKRSTLDTYHLGFGPKEGYSISWLPGEPALRSPKELLQDGTTRLDEKYLQDEAYRAANEFVTKPDGQTKTEQPRSLETQLADALNQALHAEDEGRSQKRARI